MALHHELLPHQGFRPLAVNQPAAQLAPSSACRSILEGNHPCFGCDPGLLCFFFLAALALPSLNLKRGGCSFQFWFCRFCPRPRFRHVGHTNPEMIAPSLLILSAMALASLVLAPIAAAAALRAYLK
jgi:hypothetical protein